MLAAAFVLQLFVPDALETAGLSGAAVREGRAYTLLTHMFVHAGLVHLGFNSFALLGVAIVVAERMPPTRASWARLLAFFLVCGLAGAALFLALHPDGGLPMVGASGAICGLWGAAARLHGAAEGVHPLRSRPVRRQMRAFAVSNLVLFALLWALARALGSEGGLAWQAHLGGFATGLLAAPLLVRTRDARAARNWDRAH